MHAGGRHSTFRKSMNGWPLALVCTSAGLVLAFPVLHKFGAASLAWSAMFASMMLTVFAAVLGVIRTMRFWQAAAKSKFDLCMRCQNCGFDLRGGSNGVCTECGVQNNNYPEFAELVGPRVIEKLRTSRDD